MSLNGVFALFGFPEDKDDNKGSQKKEIEDFKKSAAFKIGMFKKLIRNGILFKKQVVKFLSSSDVNLDVHGIDDAGDYMMYTRAYLWIKDFKFKSKEWKETLFNYSDDEFISLIGLSIKYFEECEEYEKCAHLKKIQDLVDKNLEIINSQK
jgi:hypothetical protein